MSIINTKHKPRASLPDIELRKVPMPRRQEKSDVDAGESIVLGCHEPEEGRYDTLSRQTYKNHQMDGSGAKSKDQVQADCRERKSFNTRRNFYWNEPQPGGALMTTENKGSHMHPSSTVLKAARETDTKGNALLMTNSSIFVSDTAVNTWKGSNSTVRADFRRPTDELLKASRGTATEFRKLQQGTHFSLGSETATPNSESRTSFQGVANKNRTEKSRVNMMSTINLGSPDLPSSQTLKSLKEVDFVDHTAPNADGTGGGAVKQPQAVRNNLQRHNLVLGYQSRVGNSLYRASYTPTVFVEEEKTVTRRPRY